MTLETVAAGWALVRGALRSLPIPGSTPERSTREPLGLHLISSALRLDHIERVTERLGLVDATHMSRHIDVDVDLGLLPEADRTALTVSTVLPDREALWVPIARHPRASLGPIVLRDGNNALVTRVTSTETNRLLASGMIRLLVLVAEAAGLPGALEGYSKDRLARWLIQAAVIALVEEGRRDFPSAPSDRQSDGVRDRAEHLVRDMLGVTAGAEQHTFLDLLDSLTRDQVVVAQFDPVSTRTRISYRAPELRGTGRRPLTWLLDRPGEFRFRYDTRVPGDVETLHVRLEVPVETEIRRFVLVSKADQRAVDVLLSDVRHLDRLARGTRAPPHQALVTYELRSIRSRLAELGRRRVDDLHRHASATRRRLPADPGRADGLNLRQLLEADGPLVVAASRLAVVDPATGGDRDAQLGRRELSALLQRLDERLDAVDLGLDVRMDDDPSETEGHVQWRRQASGLEPPRDPSVEAQVLVTLVDAAPSNARQILALLLGNLLLVGLLTWAVGRPGAAGAGGGAEVTVTLLLLVPGLLISRLVAWTGRSILFPLLLVPQALAYISMLANVALAVILVVLPDQQEPGGSDLVRATPLLALSVLFVTALVHVLRERSAVGKAVEVDEGLPRWLFDGSGRGHRWPRPPTVTFVEPHPATLPSGVGP